MVAPDGELRRPRTEKSGRPSAGHCGAGGRPAFDNAKHGFTDNGNTGTLTLSGNSTFSNSGTGFDADTAGARAGLTANLAVSDGRPASRGADPASSGNSWDIGGTWNDASVMSTDTDAVTAPRGTDGSLPSAPAFLVPRNGAPLGARL
ncbi:hypothetical protein [Streptomyces atroolivaceus]|uniref:hypothetical protein n=1 Tax=Streptomyces atroolivaceus TaxID=66869 RepID=UPI0036736588